MNYCSGTIPPPMVESSKSLGRKQYTINFDAVKQDDGTFLWATVTLAPGLWSYGSIVAAIIDSRYSPNELQAISTNMLGILAGCFSDLSENKIDEYKRECQDLVKWREHAKEIAKEALNYNPT